jgi:hypothetical protein
MPEPLFATFSASYAFLQNSCCKATAHFPSVLEAVGDRFRHAVDTNRDSIDLRIDDSLRERLAGKSNKAQLQAIDNRFLGFGIDGHPNVTRIRRENAVPDECRLKAHNTVGYSQAREGDLMFEIRGKISAGIQTAADLDEQSPARGFAQVVGMDTKRIQLARTHDSPFLDNRNEPLHGQSCCCQVGAPKTKLLSPRPALAIVPQISIRGKVGILKSGLKIGEQFGEQLFPNTSCLTRKRG